MTDIIVWIIVACAAVYVIRTYYKTLSGKNPGCTCDDSCTSCDSASGKEGQKLSGFPKKQ